jgi:hypothetical protein
MSLKIPKGVIRIRRSKDRQHNGQENKDKKTNNDPQNIHTKLKTEQHKLALTISLIGRYITIEQTI